MLTPKQAAEILCTTPETLRRWEVDGKISSIKTKGGHRRFDEQEVLALKGITLPRIDKSNAKDKLDQLLLKQQNKLNRKTWLAELKNNGLNDLKMFGFILVFSITFSEDSIWDYLLSGLALLTFMSSCYPYYRKRHELDDKQRKEVLLFESLFGILLLVTMVITRFI